MDMNRIYRAYKYCLDKCRLVFDGGQIKMFVALIYEIKVVDLNDIIDLYNN